MPKTRATNKLNSSLPPSPITNATTNIVTPSPSKQVTFIKDSEQWIITSKETYFEFSLDLLKSNLETYRKMLQQMYQIIKELDEKAVIIKYKVEVTKNEHGVGIQAKDALLNFSEAIPKYLVYLYDYFPNGRPNRKRLYSKFCILYDQDMEKIMTAVKDVIFDYKFYYKQQPL